MKKYIVVAETGADIPADIVNQYGLYIVPMHVDFGGTTKADGSFPVEEVFQFYKSSGKLPKTSGCNPGDFTLVFDRVHEEHPESHIIYLAYSAVTTCSYQSAVIAGEGRDYITYIDTKQVSAGQCLIVYLTLQYLEENPDAKLEDVIAKVHELIDLCHMGFFPGDLDYLRAGGRVSNVAYLGAKILLLNPLIEIDDGKLLAKKKYRGNIARAAQKMFTDFTQLHHFSKDILFFIFSAGFAQSAKDDLTKQAKEMGFKNIRWIQTGSVVSTHSGPGAFGVCGISEK